MKTRRLRISQLIALIIVALVVLSSCAVGQPTGTIQAPSLNMITCLPSYVGTESVCLLPIFALQNPNDFEVELELNYGLKVNGELVGQSQVPKIYIPAGKTVQLRDTIVIPFMTWFLGTAIGGEKGKVGGLQLVIPLWKGLGGQHPAVVPDMLWKMPAANELTIVAEGSISVSSALGQKVFPIKTEWQESK